MATVHLDRVTLQYPGTDRPSVTELELDIADGEFLVLVGPSGCGKSTSLRMLAGLEAVTTGAIRIDARDVTNVPANKRDVAMVFQNYALYPNMTVAQNMGFALRNAGVSKAEVTKQVTEVATILELTELLDRKPARLSGGQRQRVAMGRAIVRHPKVFAMDEPLSNLDARLRVSTRAQISALQRRLGVTTVYVTHDQVEAMTMGDRVAVMKDGLLQQVGAPNELYDNPDTTFVAGFIGSPGMNVLAVSLTADAAVVGSVQVAVPAPVRARAEEGLSIGIRPEGVQLSTGNDAVVTLVEELGAESLVHLDCALPADRDLTGGATLAVVARVPRRSGVAAGDTVGVTFPASEVLYFDGAGDRIR